MLILGISAFFHDSAAAIIINGKVIAAAQEERFSRIKNDASFPLKAIAFCLEFAEVGIDELDAIVFYDKPLLKFERLLESYHATAPKGLRSFITSMPVWIRQKMMLKKVIRDELEKIQPYNKKRLKLLFSEHHLSHAASAYYPSPFWEAAVITIDGVGEWATTSICKAEGNTITVLKEIRFPHSLGLLYSAFTFYCGFKVNSGEYKLMGLAPYGDEASQQFLHYKNIIETKLCTLADDGSFILHQQYFDYISGLKMVNTKKWQQLFGFPARKPESAIELHHCNMALAIQKFTEKVILRLAATAKKITGSENVCLAGGVALNCVANGKLLDATIFKNIYIQPAAGDAGGALGAALAAYHIYFDKERTDSIEKDGMQNTYLGPSYDDKQIERLSKTKQAVYHEYENVEVLILTIASSLSKGKIVGWFQDRMEFGPRALGNRSILADARSADMQRKLNLQTKFRESFRPFAPVCTIERAREYFNLQTPSPYMLITRQLDQAYHFSLPENYRQLPLEQKLYTNRSKLPAITHVDMSCRVQTVSEKDNKKLWHLLDAFEKITGESLLINTSFNVRGEPIVCTPEEAYTCFMNTGMDILVLNNYIFFKEEQTTVANQNKIYSKSLD